jgi:hypothetical protein
MQATLVTARDGAEPDILTDSRPARDNKEIVFRHNPNGVPNVSTCSDDLLDLLTSLTS